MHINFKNKVILITGTSGKIGKKIFKFFKNEKAIVYGIDIKKQKSNNFFQGDIANKDFVEIIFKNLIKKHNKIDIMINNAAKSIFTNPKLRTKKELNLVTETNLHGTINLINTFIKYKKKKNNSFSKIINIGSIYGVVSPNFEIYGSNDNFNSEIYGATKAGIIQLTKYFAILSSKKKINVNCVSPGGIKDKNHTNFFKRNYIEKVPLKKMGEVNDLLGIIALLSSQYSNYITGQNIMVDGGFTTW
jgi:NAD(P)-dependent dehydrogenase (short-subunit alcohol dehydrogenase family)